MGFQTFLALLLCIVSILAGVAPVKYPQYAGIADFVFWAALFLLFALIATMVWSNRKHLIARGKRLTGIQWLLLSGIGGTWLFLTITLVSIGWAILSNQGLGASILKLDRHLTENEKSRLLAELGPESHEFKLLHDYGVSIFASDTESIQYADEFAAIFKRAGIPCRDPQPIILRRTDLTGIIVAASIGIP
jgi:hypothetical protein